MKKILLFALAGSLALSGCDSKKGADNYSFETKQYTAQSYNITVTEHRNREDLMKAYEAYTKKPAENGERGVAAYTVMTYKDGLATCNIHIIDPTNSYEPEFIGHEFVHCVHGQFHPTQP